MFLKKNFFERDSGVVAKGLLGKTLVKGSLSGLIVETEAYFGENDPASHASAKKSKRNHLMFGEPGTIYVYLNYGVHYLFNVVTEEKGVAGAVLIRALEPLTGLKTMKKKRKISNLKNLCSGPGKWTQAFGIDKRFNGLSVVEKNSVIKILDSRKKFEIVSTPRIGIKKGLDLNTRFFIKNNKFVSKK